MAEFWQRLKDRLDALRRELVRILTVLNSDVEPAGALVRDRFTIDDGVDYDLPLVVPDWLSGDRRQRYVEQAVSEAAATFHHQFDRPYRYSENLSQFPTVDPLREWDYATRKEILARCHLAHERNPMANTAVGLTTLFAMGTGLTVTYRNADVEAVLEEFRANPENAVEQNEKLWCTDLQVDGELFIQFHEGQDGQLVVVPIPPWEIDWIKTERGFLRRPLVYHRIGVETDGMPGGETENLDLEIPAGQVLHAAINHHSYELRGRSELFRILPWLKAYKDWLEGRARQNHWRGSLLYDVTITGATPAQVAAKRAQYRQPPPPGSVAIHNEKEAWEILDSRVGAGDVAEDGRQIKLMAAVGKKLPEYMLSDGENANLASSTSQQLPALAAFADFQDVLVNQVWAPIYRRVVEAAVAAGTLAETVQAQAADGSALLDEDGQPVMVRAVEAFAVAAPELSKEDPKNLAEALQIATTHEWASNETASGRMGFDYRMEQKKVEQELAKERERIAQGLRPGALPDNPADYPDDDGAGDQGGDDESAKDEAKESALPAAQPTEQRHVVDINVSATDQEARRIAAENQAQAVQALAQVEMLGAQVAGVERQVAGMPAELAGLRQRQAELERQAEAREASHMAAVRQLMDALEEQSEAPARIEIDEALVKRLAERVAKQTARSVAEQTVRASETVAQDVTKHDRQGRALEVQRVLASGRVVTYRIVRDATDRISGLERIEQGES